MINVAYLAYYNPDKSYDIEVVNEFIQSYELHNAGLEHKFTIIAKNWAKNSTEFEQLTKLANKHKAELLELPDDGLDFGAYFRASKILKDEYLFFIGSSVHIIKDDWLKLHMDAFKSDNRIKLAGPMGSFEQGSATKYPNPHLRTCAFMVDRKLFSKYADTQKFPKTKDDVWAIEHSSNSINTYMLENNFRVVVVNSKGEIFDTENCNKSKTYFHPEQQEYAIFNDKWSRQYDDKDIKQKLIKERVVWTKNISEFPQNYELENSEKLRIYVPVFDLCKTISSKIFKPLFYGPMGERIDTKAPVCPCIKDKIKYNLITFRELECYKWVLDNIDSINSEYIGFSQYNKFLNIDFDKASQQEFLYSDFENKLTKQNDEIILEKIKDYDIILTPKLKLDNTNLFQQYNLVFDNINESKINFTILNSNINYKKALEETLNSSEIYLLGNFIMKKEILKDFLKWLLTIVSNLEKQQIHSKYADSVGSVFQTERFLNVWLNANKNLKIKETNTYNIRY